MNQSAIFIFNNKHIDFVSGKILENKCEQPNKTIGIFSYRKGKKTVKRPRFVGYLYITKREVLFIPKTELVLGGESLSIIEGFICQLKSGKIKYQKGEFK